MSIEVEILEHTKTCLMVIKIDDREFSITREEAFELHEKIEAKLGQMPFKL